MLSTELKQKMITVYDHKVAQKGAQVGISFYAFFANKKHPSRIINGGGHLVDSNP